jgi:hypothetical protein
VELARRVETWSFDALLVADSQNLNADVWIDIDRFAVCGPADEVVERLAALGELGIERIIVVPGSLDADPAAVEELNQRFAEDVLPALR